MPKALSRTAPPKVIGDILDGVFDATLKCRFGIEARSISLSERVGNLADGVAESGTDRLPMKVGEGVDSCGQRKLKREDASLQRL